MSIAITVSTKTWIIGVYGIYLSPEEQAELEGVLTEGEFFAEDDDDRHQNGCVEAIKWIGSRQGFRDDACEGDSVIQIWRENKDTKEPTEVYRHARILYKHEGNRCTWFVVESVAGTLTWDEFRERLVQVGGLKNVGPNSARCLSKRHEAALLGFWAPDA